MIRKFLVGLVVWFALLLSAPANAACAGGTCFGIAAGNWNTSGTWSILSGGVSCACTPATGDAIVLDANSGAGSYNVNAAFSIVTFDATNFTGTLSGASNLTITGNTFKYGSGMTVTWAGSITFASTSGTTAITSAGKSFFAGITLDGVGGTFQLQDAIICTSSITLTNGTFNANNFNVTLGGTNAAGLLSNNSNTRTITMGSGLWTLGNWTTTVVTGLTFNKNTANIVFIDVVDTSRTFNTGGLTFNNISLNTSTGYGVFTVAASPTFAQFNITAPNFIAITSGTTVTITTAPTWTGTAGNGIRVGASVSTSAGTISIASGTWSCDYCAVYGITATGGATFNATNSVNLKNNAGITFSGGGGSTGHIIGTPF